MSTAFVFPGQGSQSVGMLSELAADFPVVTETFSEASERLDYDLWALVQNGPDSELNLTHITQPAMLAAGVATWRVWCEKDGTQPSMMAGHSLGEYSALVCANAIDFGDAIALVAERGKLMQTAVPAGVGAMAAVLGLDDDQVITVCQQAAQNEVVQAVNFNSPGQVVVAGHASAVERAVEAAKAAGARRAMVLPVSVPSHCALMESAAQRLAERLADTKISSPSISVIHNVDVESHSSPDEIRGALVKQLHNPVRWAETVKRMGSDGVTSLIECGPGKVLAGLTKRIDRSITGAALFDSATLAKAIES